jgi:hypothetical protein
MHIDLTLEGCAMEVKEIQDSMSGLAFSRLADTAAWVHASWTLAQAQGALRRAQCTPGAGTCELEAAAIAIRSARAALRELMSLRPRSDVYVAIASAAIGGRVIRHD